MAAAEARAVWQRTTNRRFLQEDAKRAPKLACYPSTSSLLAKQAKTRPANTADLNDNFALLDKSFYSNLSQDSRWWLQLQPEYIYQWGLTNRSSHQFDDNEDGGIKNSFDGMNPQLKESYEFVEMDSVDFKELNEFSLDPKFHPWWRVTEKHDLASFVSNTSHEFIKNCDLPQPMDTSWKPQKVECQIAISRVEGQPVTSKPNSPLSKVSRDSAIHRDLKERPMHEMDPCKAKILEALRHSQTRAREAENAAKEAYAEKEHVVKLLFKQASQLFAYKQWLYLLQLENLCYQMKSNPVSPWGVPCKMEKPCKNLKRLPMKGKTRSRHGVRRYEHDIGKYAVVFAMGLGLVGAGLLLGWTVGWMLI